MDVWRPLPEKSKGSASYFLSIVDDYSRKATVYLMKETSQTFSFFYQCQALSERKFGKKIQRTKMNNGMEFCTTYFEDYLKTQGIKVERTNAYCPEMNVVAERLNHMALEGLQALLKEGKLPKDVGRSLVNFYLPKEPVKI